MRPLIALPGSQPRALLDALRSTLTADGPAVLPFASAPVDVPSEVEPDVALVIETSGSTGVPKRVALGRGALLAHAAASADALVPRMRASSAQWLLALPAHYVAGAQVLVRSIIAGTEPVILGDGHFDAARFVAAAERMTGEKRFVSLVPTQLRRLVDAKGEAGVVGVLRRFDAILIGGQALDPALAAAARALGASIVTTYGSSETGGGCVYDGRPIGGVSARTVDGRLELGGPTLASGYLDDPDRTAAAFYDDGGVRWYRTGDLGDVAPDGRVVVRGRADGVIISGGEKVNLHLVERAVRAWPTLGEAVVVAAPDAEWGTVPVVVTAGEGHPSLAEVRDSVAAELGRAAAPARLLVVDEIPQLASGKPDRVAITALARDPDSGSSRRSR